MSLINQPRRLPFWQRLFFAIPVFGWVAKDLVFGDRSNVWFALLGFVSLWLSCGLVFGPAGLALIALALVPIVFTVLILITWA